METRCLNMEVPITHQGEGIPTTGMRPVTIPTIYGICRKIMITIPPAKRWRRDLSLACDQKTPGQDQNI